VLTPDGESIVAVTGPESCFQLTIVIVAPLFPVAVPVNVVELAGNVIACPFPALTVGGTMAAGLTTTVTVELDESPLFSLAVNSNT
jgi:hypothetical protein